MSYHLAELNIGRFKEPLDQPSMREFTDFLDPVNTWAEESPGFIWRLKDDDGRSSSYVSNPFEGEDMIVNFSVWKDLKSLQDFTFHTVHAYFLKHRANWFHRMDTHHLVMWWIKEGTTPTLLEAKERLNHLEKNGPSLHAFTMKASFPMPTH